MNIVEFVEAQLAEDEAVARAAICSCGGPVCSNPETGWYHRPELIERLHDGVEAEDMRPLGDSVSHVLRFSPSRVLAECRAKRAIVAEHTNPHGYGFCPVCWDSDVEEPLPENCPTLRALAAVYKDRPGFRKEWE